VGELIPVSKEIATDVVKLKNKLWDLSKKDTKKAVNYFMDNYPVTKDAAEKAVNWVKKMTWSEPAIEIFNKFAFIHVPLGSRANTALGKLLAGFFSLRLGYSVGMRSDQYRIMLEFPSPTDGKFIQKVLASIKTKHVEANLVTIMRHTPLFKHRFLQVAKRFGVLSRGSDLGRFGLNRLIEAFKGSPIEHEALNEIFTEKLDFQTLVRSIQSLRKLPVRKGPSPMAVQMLENYAPELIGLRPESEILKALKQRLEKRRFNLKCLYCKKWKGSGTPLTAPLKCPNCGAGLISVLSQFETQKSMNLSAELYLNYRRKLLLVLAGRGIGPETAKKILARGKDKKTLLKLILKAEKLYARTKRFWKN
jgi:ATP-dependent Lhr-like helicase